MKKIFLILILILSWSICLAAMPHALKNGEVVDANQLNDNFNYLEKLTKLDTSGDPHPTYANGVLIGDSTLSGGGAGLTFNPDFEPVTLLKTGEIMGGWPHFQFIEPDCTGDYYITFSDYPFPENSFLFGHPKGKIYKNQSSNELYYYPPKAQTMYAKIPLSYKNSYSNGCSNYNYLMPPTRYYYKHDSGGIGNFSSPPTGDDWTEMTQVEIDIYLTKILIKLLPNDPAITGIQVYPFPLPITFDGKNEAVIIQE